MSKKDQEILELKEALAWEKQLRKGCEASHRLAMEDLEENIEALSRARQQRDMYKNALDSNKVKSIDEMVKALYDSPTKFGNYRWCEISTEQKDFWTGELMKIIS